MKLRLAIIPLITATALLSGCMSMDQGQALQARVNDQQSQINALNIRLQSVESRTASQERNLRNAILETDKYCYLNGARYSVGTVLYGRLCDSESGSTVWATYHR